MQLLLMCWRLTALRAERWLPPRRPGEHDDGREVNESVGKGHTVVLNTMQCDAVGHHYSILPFVSEVVERLWGEGVGEREGFQSIMCALFRCRTRTTRILLTSFWLRKSCPMIGPLSSGAGNLDPRCRRFSWLG